MIGVDAHKRTHTLVAVDEAGRKLGERTLAATSEGHLQAARWAGQWPGARFAVEDCRHLTRRLEGDLLAAGFAVVRVHTRLMAAERRGGRERASPTRSTRWRSRAALREPDLPVACLGGPARTVKLLSDHRGDLVAERTRLCGRLHELDPGLQVPSRGLRRYHVLDEVAARLAAMDGVVARIAAELVVRCRELTKRTNELEREIGALVRHLAPALLGIPGCGVLSAAMIVGETARVSRFRSRDAFAGSPGPPRSRSGPATPSGSGSTAAGTAP